MLNCRVGWNLQGVDIFQIFIMWRGGNKMTYWKYCNNPERSRIVDDPTTLDVVVDSVPPDKGCEVLDGEFTHEKWDENNSENSADSPDSHVLLKWGGVITKCYEGWKISKSAI